MLTFQSPHHLVILFIATLVTKFAFTQATTLNCLGGYSLNSDKKTATCLDKENKVWSCPIAKCQREGHLWVSMKSCVHNSPRASGTSDQQCSEYNNQSNTFYACRNPGGQVYYCPATPSAVPYLTCSDCVKPKISTTLNSSTRY
ncbi:uncharacterized protein MELLADRAFT_123224 [Melampsora larici-populina 98AG31]|uniref:Secreted protein n=1 Tax=Melampsora larici-populina (strain 98AG31 / pathotype 3-4-7) TaxID=747676 RepID=F4RL25_MELLP|nr:uncharacterized protein MELLADRAFT_123224 [Melampsora larici-populina 98AG31]EGG06829.1 secreted protein [Melampsora larici-populina 98AG31]